MRRIPGMWYICWTFGIIITIGILVIPQLYKYLFVIGLLSAITSSFMLGSALIARKRLDENKNSCINNRNRQRWYLGQGYRFIAWFSGHNLIWISLGLIVSGIVLSALGRHPIIQSIAAGLISCAIFSLAGIWWDRKPITLCVCWPLMLTRISGYWSRGCATLKIKDRFEYSRQLDDSAFYQRLIATWSSEVTVERKGPFLLMPNLPTAAFRQEFRNRFISLSFPFLIIFFFTIPLFYLIQRPVDNLAAVYQMQNLLAAQSQLNEMPQGSQETMGGAGGDANKQGASGAESNDSGGGKNGQGQSNTDSESDSTGGAGGSGQAGEQPNADSGSDSTGGADGSGQAGEQQNADSKSDSAGGAGDTDQSEGQPDAESGDGATTDSGEKSNEQGLSSDVTNESSGNDQAGQDQDVDSQDESSSDARQAQSGTAGSDQQSADSKEQQSDNRDSAESTSGSAGAEQESNPDKTGDQQDADEGAQGEQNDGETLQGKSSNPESSQDNDIQNEREMSGGDQSENPSGAEQESPDSLRDTGTTEENTGSESQSGAGSGNGGQGTTPVEQEINDESQQQNGGSMPGDEQNSSSQDKTTGETWEDQAKTPPQTDVQTNNPSLDTPGQRIDLEVPALTGVGADDEEETTEPQGDVLLLESSKFVPQRNIPQPTIHPLQWIPNWILDLLGF